MSDYIIGLTGGIASGKSALEREFMALGIFVADADRIARDIVVNDGELAHLQAAIQALDARYRALAAAQKNS